MIPASSNLDQRVRFPGIKVRTEKGKPAKVYQDDTPLAFTNDSGDAVGTVENITEYTEGTRTGTMFDAVIAPGPSGAGASLLTLNADADADAGETRHISEQFNYTATDPEASAFEFPEPVTEDLPA